MDQSAGQQNVQQSLPASQQTQKPSKSYFKSFFSERLNRRNYLLGSVLASILIYPSAFMLIIGPSSPSILAPFAFFDFLLILFNAILMARRLHDLNLSGWFALLYQLLIYFIIFYPIYTRNYNLFYLNNLFNLIQILLFILPGNSGDNKYGATPLPKINIIKDILQL